MAYEDDDYEVYQEPEVEESVEEPVPETPAPTTAPEPEPESEPPLPRNQYAAATVATGTMTDASPPAKDDYEIYKDPTPAPAPASTTKAAADDDYEIYTDPGATLGGGLAATGKALVAPAIRSVGEAISQSSIVGPNPYDELKPAEPPPADTEDKAAFSVPAGRGAFAGERAAARRQQEANRARAQADIEEQRKVPFEERPGAKIGEAIKGAAPVITEEERKNYKVPIGIAETVSGVAGPIVAGIAGGAIGGPAGAMLGAGAYMGAQSRGAEFDRAYNTINQRIAEAQKAGDVATAKQLLDSREDVAAKSANLSTVVNTALGMVPVGMVLKPVKDIAPGLVGRAWAIADHAWKSAIPFATIGEAQKYIGEQLAKTYDPKAHYEFDFWGAVSTLIGGAIVGGGMAAGQRRAPPKPAEPPPPEPPIATPEQGRLPFPSTELPYDPKTGAPQEAQIGGGEVQLGLPLDQPKPEAPRPNIGVQPELKLEPPSTVTPEGQLGFTLDAPRGDHPSRLTGIPMTGGPDQTGATSRNPMPSTGGVAKEAAPPPRTPPAVAEPRPAPGTPGSAAAAVGGVERAEWERKQAAQPAPVAPVTPPPPSVHDLAAGPHSSVTRGTADVGPGPKAAAGINVLQPGQVDPTLQHGIKTTEPAYPPGPRTTFEPPRPPPPPPEPGPAPLPRDRSLVVPDSTSTQAVTETPAPVGHTRMYQGERHPPNVFTTDRKAAEQYGPVKYTDVHDKQGMPFFTPTNEPGSFTTRNNIYRTRARPIEELRTEPTTQTPGQPGAVKTPEATTPEPSIAKVKNDLINKHGYSYDTVKVMTDEQARLTWNIAETTKPEPPKPEVKPPGVKIASPELEQKLMGGPSIAKVRNDLIARGYSHDVVKNMSEQQAFEAWKSGEKGEVPYEQVKKDLVAAGYDKNTVDNMDEGLARVWWNLKQIKPEPPKPPAPPPLKDPSAVTKGGKGKNDEVTYFSTPLGGDRKVKFTERMTLREALAKYGVKEGLMEFTPKLRAIVEKLIGNMPVYFMPNAEFAKQGKNKYQGLYYHQQDHIFINDKYSPEAMSQTIFHEGLHGITAHAINEHPEIAGAVKSIMFDVKAKAVSTIPPHEFPYVKNAFLDAHEFIAEGFSNPRFQQFLNDHVLSPDVTKRLQAFFNTKQPIKSAWDALVQIVRKALKLPESQMSALDALIRVTEHAVEANPAAKAKYMAQGGFKAQDYGTQPDVSAASLPPGTGVSHPGRRWQIIDKQTGEVVGVYNNRRRASGRADKLDNNYGAYRYRVESVKVEEPQSSASSPPPAKGEVTARDRFGNEVKFTGETVHAAAAYAKAAGYKQIFHEDGTPYEPPKTTTQTGTQTGTQTPAKGTQTPAKGTQTPAAPTKTLPAAHAKDLASGIWSSVQRIFAPESRPSGKVGMDLLREARGSVERMSKTQEARFTNEMHYAVNKMSEADQRKLLNYIQGGAHLNTPGHEIYDPKWKPPKEVQLVADEVKKSFDAVGAALHDLPQTEKLNLLKDYLTQYWDNPAKAQEFYENRFKGTGTGSLKERTFPTYEDGIAAGLKPLTTNPIEILGHYLGGMEHFLTKSKMVNAIQDQGLGQWFAPKSIGATGSPTPAIKNAPPPGYAELPWTSRNVGGKEQTLYVPRDMAITLNNYHDAGLNANKYVGNVYEYARAMKNAWTAVELGLSVYHTTTVATEVIGSGFSRAVAQVNSNPVRAMQTLIRAITAPVSEINFGRKIIAIFEGRETGTPMQHRIVDAMEKADIRVGVKGTLDYDMGKAGSLMTSYLRGSLRKELESELKSIWGGDYTKGLMLPVDGTLRVMRTIMQPIFEKWIPWMKMASSARDLEAWLHANPTATDAQLAAAAKKITQSTDNRMGEMVTDHIGMNKAMKQTLFTALRSFSFSIGGPFMEIGGGAKSLVAGAMKGQNRLSMSSQHYDPKVSYLIGGTAAVTMISLLWTLARTGTGPQDWRDFVTARTGGRIKSAGKEVDERVLSPGYQKDFLGYAFHPKDEIKAKVAGIWTALWEQVTGKDFRDLPIAPPASKYGYWENIKGRAEHFFGKGIPLSMQQQMETPKEGSKITFPEKLIGIRAPGAYMQNPEGTKAAQERREAKDWTDREKADNRDRANRGLPPKPALKPLPTEPSSPSPDTRRPEPSRPAQYPARQ